MLPRACTLALRNRLKTSSPCGRFGFVGFLRRDRQQDRGDQRQRQADQLEAAGQGADDDQRDRRGHQRRARVGQRRHHDRLAVAEGIDQRQRPDALRSWIPAAR